MKLNKLLITVTAFIALFAFSVQAQEEKVKTDKNKKTESSKKDTKKTDREYMVGSKGGCYYLTESGKKAYVDKKNCEGLTASTTETKTTPAESKKVVDPTESDVNAAKTKESTTVEAKSETPATVETPETKPTESVTPEAKKTDTTPTPTEKKSNSDDRTYIKGSRGGCYYLNESGKKVYVKDKSLCGIQ